jgi:4,5-DOPA dioxygenase extradiol
MKNKYPVLFTGHGSPMNAITPSRFRQGWSEMGRRLGKPEAILAVSAHWFTRGQYVSDLAQNKQIFDMYGFPKELYDVAYAPAGQPEIARRVTELLDGAVQIDRSWGIDHGIWSVLCNMYPEADVPVVMFSVDAGKGPDELYETGRRLASLRDDGVMIVASGNVVHNLGLVDWNSDTGEPWALAFDRFIRDSICNNQPEKVVRYAESGLAYDKAIPTPDHFNPLLVALGAAGDDYKTEVWNEGCELGSMSMTSYLLQ